MKIQSIQNYQNNINRVDRRNTQFAAPIKESCADTFVRTSPTFEGGTLAYRFLGKYKPYREVEKYFTNSMIYFSHPRYQKEFLALAKRLLILNPQKVFPKTFMNAMNSALDGNATQDNLYFASIFQFLKYMREDSPIENSAEKRRILDSAKLLLANPQTSKQMNPEYNYDRFSDLCRKIAETDDSFQFDIADDKNLYKYLKANPELDINKHNEFEQSLLSIAVELDAPDTLLLGYLLTHKDINLDDSEFWDGIFKQDVHYNQTNYVLSTISKRKDFDINNFTVNGDNLLNFAYKNYRSDYPTNYKFFIDTIINNFPDMDINSFPNDPILYSALLERYLYKDIPYDEENRKRFEIVKSKYSQISQDSYNNSLRKEALDAINVPKKYFNMNNALYAADLLLTCKDIGNIEHVENKERIVNLIKIVAPNYSFEQLNLDTIKSKDLYYKAFPQKLENSTLLQFACSNNDWVTITDLLNKKDTNLYDSDLWKSFFIKGNYDTRTVKRLLTLLSQKKDFDINQVKFENNGNILSYLFAENTQYLDNNIINNFLDKFPDLDINVYSKNGNHILTEIISNPSISISVFDTLYNNPKTDKNVVITPEFTKKLAQLHKGNNADKARAKDFLSFIEQDIRFNQPLRIKQLYEEEGTFTLDQLENISAFGSYINLSTLIVNEIDERIAHILSDNFIDKDDESKIAQLKVILKNLHKNKYDFFVEDAIGRTAFDRALEFGNEVVADYLKQVMQQSNKDNSNLSFK